MIIKRKVFSGYSESNLSNGVNYHSANIITDYILDPTDKSIVYIENSPLYKLNSVKRNSSRIKNVIHPIKYLLNREKHDNKKI